MCANALIFYRRANIQVCRLPALAPPGSILRQVLAPNYKLANYAVLVLGRSMIVISLIMAAEENRVCEMVVLSRCLHICQQLSHAEHNVQQACQKEVLTVILILALGLYDGVSGLHTNSKDQSEAYILYPDVSDGCFHLFPSARF